MYTDYSNSKKRKGNHDVIKENKLLDQLKGNHIHDNNDDVSIVKENDDNSDHLDTPVEQAKKRKLQNNNNKNNCDDNNKNNCDNGISMYEQNSYNIPVDQKNINFDNHNKIYDHMINNNSKNSFNENNFMNYYHLHIFAFICTTINTIFKNEVDIKKFTVLTNNIIFLFNKCYSSYVVAICLINLIIKIRLDKLYDCKNYILEIFNIYNYDDVDYCINNQLLLLLALYLCPENYKKNILVEELKTEQEQNIDNHTKYNNNMQISYNENNKNLVYPYYVYSKLKYIKPHLKKVTNIHNLCLKLISLISIIHNVNEKAIKSISYFIYFSTFQNFILCFTLAQDKLISRKLNLLYKKFSFQNTDTFVLTHILNNFKIEYDLNTQGKINNDQIEDNINTLQYYNTYYEKKNAINNQMQKLMKTDQDDIEKYSYINLSKFENSYLYKFLFHLNKLKDYMKFNDGFQKYKKFKQDKNNNENRSNASCDDILEDKYFVYDIFCDILNCEPDKSIQLFKRNVFLFYERLMDKLYHLNFATNKNLLKEIIIFINQKLNKEMDCKYIFDAVMYSLCNKKEIMISPLNELYINNIFNKSLFNIKLDDSMKIFIISKINQMLTKLFNQYYQVGKYERNKINKFDKNNNYSQKNVTHMEANQNDDNKKKHVEQEENSSLNNSNNNNNINSSSRTRKQHNVELKTNQHKVYEEIDIIYEEYKKYNEQFGSDILIESVNQKDTTMNNTFDHDIYISDINSIDSDYNFDEGDDSYNSKSKDQSNDMVNLNNRDIINLHNNNHTLDTLNNINDLCTIDNMVNIFNDEEIKNIKFINKMKDLKKLFGIDSYYMNNILKCIATLLINFPIITKNKMIELFHVMFLNNKKYILISTKNLLVEYFYSLSNEKKINNLRKIITNPLKKLDYNHLFFIFSNNHMNICLKHLIKYYQKQKKIYFFKNNDDTKYDYNGSVIMNNCLFYYQHLIVYENLFQITKKKGRLGFNFLFALIKNYIKNCKAHITDLYNKHKQNIKYLNSEEFHCYGENIYNINSLTVDLRAEEQNIVTSLLYTSTKMKVSSLSKLFDNLISCFENKIFESTSSNILDNYKSTYEKRIYYIFFYRLYKNFGSVLNSSNKYLYDLLNNIKFTLISCQKNSQDIFQVGKNHTYNKYMQNGQVEKIKNKLGDQFDDNTYYDNINETLLNKNNEELQDRVEEKGLILNNKDKNNNNNNNNLKSKWYWFDLGYPTLMCLYEILKSEKNNQTNMNPIFFNTCFDDVLNYFNIFQYLPRIHINDQFENNVNEKILTNSEHFDMKMVSIILLDMLKLILCRYYILYLNDPEKIQIMTMRLSLKNSDNHINSYNITICIILTLKYIYETIGYNQLLFSVKDLYQIFSELNNHPDDEIEYISKQWFNTIRKNSEVGNI